MKYKRLLALMMASVMTLSQGVLPLADEYVEAEEETAGIGGDFEKLPEEEFFEEDQVVIDDQWNESFAEDTLQAGLYDDSDHVETLFEENLESMTESYTEFSDDPLIGDGLEEVAQETEMELHAAGINTETSGFCGDHLTWVLNSEGILTISGSGEMYDYDNGWEPSTDSPFYGRRDIYEIVVESGVTSIGGWAFCECTNLRSITIPSGVTRIELCAFWDCTGLTSITISAGVTTIDYCAFNGCTSLTSITIPFGVTSIGGYAFMDCTGLRSITIPSSVTSIDEDAFQGCDQLTIYGCSGSYAQIYANEHNISFTVSDGVDIPSGAGLYNGHYYYVFNLKKDWAQAKAYCESRGGYLATITSREENDFVFKYMKDSGFSSAYFGFTDEISEGNWKWVSGEPTGYTNWASGEPNGENSREDYAMFYYKFAAGEWNDGDFGANAAGNTTAFICEWGEPENGTAWGYDDIHDGFLHSLEYYAITSSVEYNPELARDLMKLALDSYGNNTDRNEHNIGTDAELKADYENLGFDVRNHYYSKNYDKWTYLQNYCGFSYAVKDKPNGGRIVAITIRGTVGEISEFAPEWVSDFLGAVPSIYVTGWHMGFYNPACEIFNSLKENGLIDVSNTTYFITGHSRGAGVGNILSVFLSRAGIRKENLYDYNFACPDTMYAQIGTDWSGGGRYNSIFNINAANDLVGVLPGVLGNLLGVKASNMRNGTPLCAWGKYGKTYFYSFKWNSIEDSMVDPIRFIKEQGAPHEPSRYYDYLEQKNNTGSFRSYMEVKKQNLKCIFGYCPVNMTIVDGNGAEVVTVRNGEVIYYNHYGMSDAFVMTDGDFKAFFVDPSIDFKVKIEASDNGEMKFVSGVADVSTGEFQCEKCFENVKLEKGKTFISEGLSQTSAENVKLYTTDAQGNKIAEISSNGTETKIAEPVTPQPEKAAEKITISRKPTIRKLTATKNRITVKWKHFKPTSKKTKKIWKKIKKVQVQCAADKGFKKIVKKTVVGKSKTSVSIKGLKKNKNYYVRVRYYDGKGYSKWSKAKKIKTKKK